MSINLSNLNISLDKFNSEASGKLNIGQIKLSSDGKSVYRTNNHKSWTILNMTSISPEEAVAVKFAFCKALSKEGLSQDAINAVKVKLGIPGSALDALKAGNVKPLTAAEVRDVIDQFAGEINKNRAASPNGPAALKTSAEIYRGVTQKEMENRASIRDEINEQSIKKLMTRTDESVNNLLDMLQFGEQGETATKTTKLIAKEILIRLSNRAAFSNDSKSVEIQTGDFKFTLQSSGKITANFTIENGNKFSIDTGLDREGLVNKATAVLNAIAAAASNTPASTPLAESKTGEKTGPDALLNAINELDDVEIETEEKGKKDDKGDNGVSNKVLLDKLKTIFNELQRADPETRKKLSSSNLEDAVSLLQKAMSKARPLDNRNTEIINKVREVFYGNRDIDTDYLLKTISDVLDKKPQNSGARLNEDFRNNVKDDLDEVLKINKLLGIDDEITGAAKVEGFGQNAKKVREAHARLVKTADEKTGRTAEERRNANILGIVNRGICDDCKKMAEGKWNTVTFANDIIRNLNVMLPNGTRLAGDFEKARDQLSSLVAKDAKYADLSEKDKSKVHVLMAILNQRAGQGLLFSEGLTLDPKGNESKIFFGGAEGKGAVNYAYTLSFSKDGSLNIKCETSQVGFNTLMLFGGAKDGLAPVFITPGKDSKVNATMELKVPMDELDRLAGLDYTKYDDKGVKAKYSDPNIQNRYSDRTLLGEDYMIDDTKITCNTTYSLLVN